MRLVLHADAVALGIEHPVACVVSGVWVEPPSDRLDEALAAGRERIVRGAGEILRRPEVAGFRALFAALGYPRQVPAGESLVRRFQEGKVRRHGNVVDAYNVASALYGSGLGMHDASGLGPDPVLHVCRARGEETIVPLFESEAVRIPAGDLVYGIEVGGGMCPMAWLGKRDVDGDAFRVGPGSAALLLVALGNAATSEDYNRSVCEKALELIRLSCPGARAETLETARPEPAEPGEDSRR